MKTEEFLSRVCDQIRCSKAHPLVRDELLAHVEDQKQAYIQAGVKEQAAEEQAVAEMGDPVIVGGQMDRVHRPKPAWNVAILSAVMLLTGGCLQWALGFWAEGADLGSWIVGAAVAVAVLLAVYFADYTFFARHSIGLYLLLLVAGGVLIRIICLQDVSISRIFTARESISLLQYYVSLLAVPLFAGIVYRCRNRGYGGILICLFFLILAIYGACLAPSSLAALTFGLAAVSLMTLAIWKGHFGGNRKRQTAFFWATGFAVCFCMIMGLSMSGMLYEYRLWRIINTFFPQVAGDGMGSGWNCGVLRQLWSASNLTGGADQSVGPLLESINTTDLFQRSYPLTILATQRGIWGAVVIAAFFLVILWALGSLARKQKNALGCLMAWSVTFAFGYSGLLYILSNLGLLNLATGILPFISPGGGGLVVSAVLIGLFLSVCKGNDYIRDRDVEAGVDGEGSESWIDRKLLKYRVRITVERK